MGIDFGFAKSAAEGLAADRLGHALAAQAHPNTPARQPAIDIWNDSSFRTAYETDEIRFIMDFTRYDTHAFCQSLFRLHSAPRRLRRLRHQPQRPSSRWPAAPAARSIRP